MGLNVLPKYFQPWIQWLQTLWKFSRPHTIIGTSLSVLGLAAIALAASLQAKGSGSGLASIAQIPWPQTIGLILSALIPSLCANVYIVGLNQLKDVEIDRVNKPGLPLASGDFSRTEGVAIVIATGILALVLSAMGGQFLFLTVLASIGIGTAYSLPPLRLKRFPFWAALCIFGVRGLVVNLGFFLHFQEHLGGSGAIPLQVWALTAFVILFAFAIAIFKDIPDAKGDRLFQIGTLALRLGIPAVFNLALWVLTGGYLLLIAAAALGSIPVQPLFSIATHLGLLVWLWLRSSRVDLEDNRSISQFYQFIWKLFFLEYLLFPLACLLTI
ncbi:homogentisate phytyltransferase [Altericista sp. CCNU0014]|uniref:homogentisate phytyltransferase n=1 Tax=Altericista sp. CCNU0014 TaxID=3082949 RepID=UPI00385124B2